ncbi:MAG: hypothetical protein HKN49_12105, partial [Gammaproteobacteria bacterium]|nr:hypothetical protein [Gammaproteobacteria bacterium]
IELGGRIQLQYVNMDPDVGDSSDDLFFRRLRPYIAGTVTADWDGKIQIDFGKSAGDNEVAVKDAYMRYTGWDNLSLFIGNTKTPFAREFLASSKRQQLVERSFAGDHNYGAPDRQLGLRLDGSTADKKLAYKLSLGAESHDPDVRRLDFDTPVNESGDWNEGVVVAGRLDYMPMGSMKYDQVDFRSDSLKMGFGLAVFSWSNDDDNNTYTDANGVALSGSKADLDSATGVEVSVSARGNGFSADVDYQSIDADTVVSDFTGGVYSNGGTDLEKIAVEGGYLFPNNVELVAAWDTQDADGYATPWERTSVGANYYFNKHKMKAQFTYRMGKNVNGVRGTDEHTGFMQFQFVF